MEAHCFHSKHTTLAKSLSNHNGEYLCNEVAPEPTLEMYMQFCSKCSCKDKQFYVAIRN